MRDLKLYDPHGQAAVAPETRRVPDAAFTPKVLVLRPPAEALEELLELANSYARDNDRLRAECAWSRAAIDQSYDVLIRVPDCRCKRWDSGHAGCKAQEGIAKREGNSAKWATVDPCASGTAGGIWSVRW
jgi:hypothetical protein